MSRQFSVMTIKHLLITLTRKIKGGILTTVESYEWSKVCMGLLRGYLRGYLHKLTIVNDASCKFGEGYHW